MKAISLSRPWPYAILNCGKRLENRQRKDGRMPHICRHRGPLLLHAAKSWDDGAGAAMVDAGIIDKAPTHLLVDRQARHLHPAGGIVGRCRAVAHMEPGAPNVQLRAYDSGGIPLDLTAAERGRHQTLLAGLDCRWWFGGYALILANIEPTPFVPCRGALGLWTPPDDVLAQLGLS